MERRGTVGECCCCHGWNEKSLYEQYRFDEPWDGRNNRKLIEKIPAVYRASNADGDMQQYTQFVVPVGDNAPFRETYLKEKPPARPPFALGRRRALRRDWMLLGLADAERRIPWTKPEDIDVDEELPGFGKAGGFAASFSDEAGRFGLFSFYNVTFFSVAIRTSIPNEQYRELFSRRRSSKLPWDQIPRYEPPTRRRGILNPLVIHLQKGDGETSARLFFRR